MTMGIIRGESTTNVMIAMMKSIILLITCLYNKMLGVRPFDFAQDK